MTDSRNTLFINHFHTLRSNSYVTEHGSSEKWEGNNHFGSPLQILERLGEGQNAVITVTEHLHTNGPEFFEDLMARAPEKSG